MAKSLLIDAPMQIIDYIRNYREGDRLAEFNRDIGYTRSPEDIEMLRRNIPEYGFVNPNVVAKANDDLNQQLAAYKTAETLAKTTQESDLVRSAIGEAASLYPEWREVVGPYAPVSQFYSDYKGRIPGEALALEPYQKAFAQLQGGITEGENRAITAKNTGDDRAGREAWRTKATNTPLPTNPAEFNAYRTDLVGTPNADPKEIEDFLKSYVDYNSAPVGTGTTVSTQGQETEKNTYGTDFLGRYVAGTSANAKYNPEDAQLKREGHRIAKEQLKYSKENKDEGVLLKLLEDIDKSDSLLVDLNSNLLDTIDAAKNPDGYVTEKDVLKARDNIAKAESTKISKMNAYGRRKWNVKQIPAGYNYDRDNDAFFNPNAPQGKRYWRP